MTLRGSLGGESPQKRCAAGRAGFSCSDPPSRDSAVHHRFYFSRFEDVVPPEPLPYSRARELLFRLLAGIAAVLGTLYLYWRWTESLNPEALWFSAALAGAETCAFVNGLLFYFNIHNSRDTPPPPPPEFINECVRPAAQPRQLRPLTVDVYITTYDEDPELVRLSIEAANALSYPPRHRIRIYVLDDGARPQMRLVAEQEGATYLARSDHAGHKAGNLRHALLRTDGDFILLCDADTRPFPNILANTLGYFRDPSVAWVQTPQWFFDIPPGQPLEQLLGRWFGRAGTLAAHFVERLLGPIRVGGDPLGADPRLFYDVVLRRRQWANAVFCCGAASIHRREAVMVSAVRRYAADVESIAHNRSDGPSLSDARRSNGPVRDIIEDRAPEAEVTAEIRPYEYHVSEDIVTSVELHGADPRWKSAYYPWVQSKMLSPQDLLSWSRQHFRYAAGTLDLALRHKYLWTGNLTAAQRLMYGATVWSYLSGLYNCIFLMIPIIYLGFGVAPVNTYSGQLLLRLVPFLVMNELAVMVGTWGTGSFRVVATELASFSLYLRALWAVVWRRPLGFQVTPKTAVASRQPRGWPLVAPHAAIIVGTLGALFHAVGSYLGQADSSFSARAILLNGFWGMYNVLALSQMVWAAFRRPSSPLSEEEP